MMENQDKNQWFIASVSWGKDSLAMLHLLLDEKDEPALNEVVFFDTGMEFDAIYNERDRILPLLAAMGIEYTELKPKEPFLHKMFVHPVKSRETGKIHKYGYGWCGGACRWGTTEKTAALDRYAEAKNALSTLELLPMKKSALPSSTSPISAFRLQIGAIPKRIA